MTQAVSVVPRKRGSKYNARRTEYNGVWYDSTAEARYAMRLDLLVRSGEIARWERQVKFTFDRCRHCGHAMLPDNSPLTTYRADFVLYCPNGTIEVHEVKGRADRRWPVVRKLMRAFYGFRIHELRAGGRGEFVEVRRRGEKGAA